MKKIHKRIMIILRAFSIATLLILMYFLFDFGFSYYKTYQRIEQKAKSEIMLDSKLIQDAINSIERSVNDLSEKISQNSLSNNEMINHLEKEFDSNENIYAVCIAFKPDKNQEMPGLYAPFFSRKSPESKVQFLEKIYDYTKDEYQWYHEILDKGKGWIQPYWGEAGNSMMASYGKVIKAKKPDGKGEIIGLVLADFEFNMINNLLKKRDRGSFGYGFIIDNQGFVVAHPNREITISRRNFFDYSERYKKSNRKKLQSAIENKTAAHFIEKNSITGQSSYFSLSPINSTGWFIGNVIIIDEMTMPNIVFKQFSFKIITATILLAVSLTLLISFYKQRNIDELKFNKIAVLISFYFVLGLVTIWLLQVYKGEESPYQNGFIGSQEDIQEIMREQIQKAQNDRRDPPSFIETGIIVRSAKITDLNQVDVYGILWQRIPNDKDLLDGAGVMFPDAIESKFEEMYNIVENNHSVIGWRFSTSIRQNFDNSIYPFDRININLRMRQQDDFQSIIFVPDFNSYEIISPSAKSFVADNIVIPGFRVNHTYFKFYEHAYNISFGFQQKLKEDYVRDLILVISLSRDWVSNFVSVLIPIFIIIALSFTALFMITHDQDFRKQFNFDSMRMLVVGASFSLFLVIATQNLRNRIVSESVIYIEQLYFLLYFIILFNVVISLGVTKKAGSLFSYKDGLFFRVIYWPLVTSLIYVLTLISFFN